MSCPTVFNLQELEHQNSVEWKWKQTGEEWKEQDHQNHSGTWKCFANNAWQPQYEGLVA